MKLADLMVEAAAAGLFVVAEIQDGTTRYRLATTQMNSELMTLQDCKVWLAGYKAGIAN